MRQISDAPAMGKSAKIVRVHILARIAARSQSGWSTVAGEGVAHSGRRDRWMSPQYHPTRSIVKFSGRKQRPLGRDRGDNSCECMVHLTDSFGRSLYFSTFTGFARKVLSASENHMSTLLMQEG